MNARGYIFQDNHFSSKVPNQTYRREKWLFPGVGKNGGKGGLIEFFRNDVVEDGDTNKTTISCRHFHSIVCNLLHGYVAHTKERSRLLWKHDT